MPLLANAASVSSPSGFTRPRRWLWVPLVVALAAPASLAQATPPPAPEVDFVKEAERAESTSEVVRVAPEHQTAITVHGAERVRVDSSEVVEAAVGEPDQVVVQGLRRGRARLLVWRAGTRPLLVRVEVGP
ncbi:hypothetical protein HPC49_49950 [Pyxidicoccus fallax]|uniref:Pilus formation protein N-terminal domain-containing protein n=1 Tax=Pyxidicoccus fallax TaxID=394095 RepID=A0A848LUX5_9BACT|nr:pilus assembly protein N-terminal domain-containing protein [Pyxidicoccus fallax]NMO21449.1 hypothetical protein [Pyxidicoccus fallax]NPC86298.1 hypothetical protein [Pyxidicoccus fallax]